MPVCRFSLVFQVRDTSSLQPVRKRMCEAGDKVGAASLSLLPSLCALVDPGCPYVIAVHAGRRGGVGRYNLEVISESLMSVELIEPSRQKTLRGAWRSGSAGGAHIEERSWASNPQVSTPHSTLSYTTLLCSNLLSYSLLPLLYSQSSLLSSPLLYKCTRYSSRHVCTM